MQEQPSSRSLASCVEIPSGGRTTAFAAVGRETSAI